MKKLVGLYFGSFNPIHKGHLQVANYIKVHGKFDEIWFVPSPLSPHKQNDSLIPAELRLKWVSESVDIIDNMLVADDEFNLPKPSYTYKSVVHFYSKYPDCEFSLIMGADNLYGFHKWEKAAELSTICPLHVYARTGYPKPKPLPYNATWYDAPLIEISATEIRTALENSESLTEWIPDPILKELSSFFKSIETHSH